MKRITLDTKYKFDHKLFKQVVDFVETTKVIKIGILSNDPVQTDDDKSSGVGIATIAAVHEFGSATNNIPERSFLRQTHTSRMEDFKSWVEKSKGRLVQKIEEGDENAVFSEMGAWWVKAVHRTFKLQGPNWAPLSEKYAAWKKKYKKSDKILVTDGTLRDSVTFEVTNET
jgi:phage gpG-like protein